MASSDTKWVSNYNSMHHPKGGETDCNEEAAQASQSRAIDTRVPSSLISPTEIDSDDLFEIFLISLLVSIILRDFRRSDGNCVSARVPE